MVYKNGIVANSYQLTQIIHTAMRDAGWELLSGESPDGTNSVFYSDGEDGYQDIYIRVASNQHDLVATGDIQFPYSDGYNGFVNFFSYQYYDANTKEGFCDIGKNGPFMYPIDGSNTPLVEQYDFFKSSYGSGGGRINIMDSSATYYCQGNALGALCDGHKDLYFEGYNDSLIRTDLSTIPEPTQTNRRYQFFYNTSSDRPTIWSRKGSCEPMIWSLTSGYYSHTFDDNGGWSTYNTLTGAKYYGNNTSIYADPSWENARSGWGVQGVRRNRDKYIYVGQGMDLTGWERYNIDKNEWEIMAPNLPAGAYQGSCALYIMKEVTGYTYDRIYVLRGSSENDFYSIAIDNNGNPVGSWVTHSPTPDSIYYGDGMFYVGGNRIFLTYAGDDNLYYWKFPGTDTGTGSWVLVSNSWFNKIHSRYSSRRPGYAIQNHLSSRIEVDEGQVTSYWIFSNKDRIIVLTKTNESSYTSSYNFMYAGLFESAYSTSFATTTEDLGAGTSSAIKVNNTSIFKVGVYYQISYMGNSGIVYEAFNGQMHNTQKTSRILIESIDHDASEISIHSGLTDSYPAGSKIGEDVQPVGLFVYGMDQLQTLNNNNIIDDRIGEDPPFQTYNLGIAQQSAQTSSDRIDGLIVWPVILENTTISGITESEVRGKLIGVFGGGSISNESTVVIDGSTYKAFSVVSSNTLGTILVGPME